MAYMSLKNKKRIMVILIIVAFFVVILAGRLLYLQVIKYGHYSSKAYEQQTRERKVEAKRGTIYDTTGDKVLAQSISVSVITATPKNVENKEKVATDLSEIIGMDKEAILAKLNKTVATENIASKLEEEVANKVLKYISDNKIKGLRVDEDTKRIYPYKDMLAQVLGFVGTDNIGLEGLESYYNKELSGTPGKIVGATDTAGRETPFTNEQYIEPIDGNDIVLTIDATIQSVTEKYLKKAYEENIPDYAVAVALRPKTGEILAMSTMPNYDPNEPFKPIDKSLLSKWETMSSEERTNSLKDSWKNKVVTELAEPGSTFKVVTAAAVLEENVVGLDDVVFNCTGSMSISGWTIRCWRYPRTHGQESLRQGIMNSCNPVFMQASQKLGVTTYHKYLAAFNLDQKTGVDLPGEQGGIIHDKEKMTVLDMATTSFGQTISINALHTVVNYAAIANGGYLVKPYVVKEIKSSNGGYKETTESKVVKQIISKNTADQLLSALEDTVSIGTAKVGKVNGYRVGGKTGTAEEGRGSNTVYMASFIGVAPINDPEVIVLVSLYNPKGVLGHQGSTVAAPVVSSIIDETLRYLDIKPDYDIGENKEKELIVPDLTSKTVSEAKRELSSLGFSIASDTELKDDLVIKDQIPKLGASLREGSTVRVYTTEGERETAVVPDMRKKTVDSAKALAKKNGLNLRVIGSGYVLTQDPSPGTVIQKGSIVTVKCIDTTDLP